MKYLVAIATLLACASVACESPELPRVLEPRTNGQLVFRHPEECRECHPNHVDEWEGSMHAYAATDPIFHALADVMAFDFAGEAGQFCTQCHTVPGFLGGETVLETAPSGRVSHRTEGLSPVAQAGVSCDVCHSAVRVKIAQNAQIEFAPDGTVRGPIADPIPTDAHPSVESALHRSGELCTGCHNVELPFDAVGGVPLETTGIEWQAYLAAGGTEQCQDCHMPEYDGRASTDSEVTRVHRHTFVGVDIALIDDFPDRAEQAALVQQMLESAADLSTSLVTDGGGAVTGARVSIANKAGHSLPSGSTSERRMWVHIRVTDSTGAAVYESGMLDANGDLMDGYPEHSETPDGDPDLWWFGAIVTLTPERQPTRLVPFPHQADAIETFLIEPLGVASNDYAFGALPAGDYTVDVRLLYRTFQPYLIRELEDHPATNLPPGLADRVPIVTMATAQESFAIP